MQPLFVNQSQAKRLFGLSRYALKAARATAYKKPGGRMVLYRVSELTAIIESWEQCPNNQDAKTGSFGYPMAASSRTFGTGATALQSLLTA